MIVHALKTNVETLATCRPEPRYGAGELPVEYTPLNPRTLRAAEQFGPLVFQISRSSHNHHLEFISRCIGREPARNSDRLYAFEFWPLPRVMSQWRFGRLNEVISVRAERHVHFWPAAEEPLWGETTVRSVTVKNGLCFGFFDSVTKTTGGGICMTAEDVLLLANGCDSDALREAVSQVSKSGTFISAPDRASLLGSWPLQMRYAWPVTKWKNNIHTDVYAQMLGYQRGLVEGPGVADVVHAVDSARFGTGLQFRLSWKYLAPLYESTAVAVVSAPSSNADLRRYSVCEFPARLTATCRVLLQVELESSR